MTEGNLSENKGRMDELLRVMELIAGGDFSARFTPTGDHGDIDALGAGINMLVEEVQVKIAELEHANKFFVDRELAMHDLKKKNHELEESLKKTAGN